MARPLFRLAPLFRESLPILAASGLGLITASGLGLLGPWIVGQAIDVDLANGDLTGVSVRATFYAGVLAATLAVSYLARLGNEVAAQRAMLALKRKLFTHLVEHDLSFHDRHSSGRLITRVQGDTEALRVLFTEVILALPADLALFLGMFAILGWQAPSALPIVLLVLPPYILLFLLFRRISPPRFLAVRAVRAVLTGFFTEHIRAMPTLVLYNRQRWARERAEELNASVFRTELIAHLQPVWYYNAVFLVRKFGMLATLVGGGLLVAEGYLTVGSLVMSLGYLRQMFRPLMRLSHHLSTLERARAAAIRVSGILDTPRTIADPPEPVAWPGVQRGIRVEGVHFHYTPEAPVLRGLDLDIPAGSHVGIVGATGAGKSTVLNLLLRFRDPTEGAVTVDGVDLRTMRVEDVRSRIGLVLQDVHLFPGTVLDNLGGDRERSRRALDALGISTDLDHVLEEGGLNLSRGERQLLTFARALVEDPEVLVLDEATSAIDPETEERVQAALETLQAGRTTITVAHRLATVASCDCIYVLSRGRVEESGTHGQLLSQAGLYAALAQLQGLAA